MKTEVSRDEFLQIVQMRDTRQDAFQAIGELGRYPQGATIERARIHEVITKARHDALLLKQIADRLELL